MKITSPEQLIKHVLAGHSVIIKTPSRDILVDNETLMEFSMLDVIAVTREQEVCTNE